MSENSHLVESLTGLNLTEHLEEQSKLKAKIKNYPQVLCDEGFCQWFDEVADLLTPTTWSSIISTLEQHQFAESTGDDFNYDFVNDFGAQINLTMVYILQGRETESFQGIEILKNWSRKYERGLTDEREVERLKGASYAIKSLEMLAQVQFKPQSEVKVALGLAPKFEKLDPKARGFVYTMKLIFMGEFQRSAELEIEIANLVSLDFF